MFNIIVKRFLLILLGVFLSLVLLECGLRLAGFAISSYQRYKNDKVLRGKKQYTIMCLGESTTAGQYPIWLQEILNKKYPNKFSVIDCGVAATNLQNILKSLEDNINKYKPNIAICMMGINDMVFNNDKEKYPLLNKKNGIVQKFKTYKLFVLLKKHIFSLLEKNLLYASNLKKDDCIKQIEEEFFSKNNYEKVINIAEKILKENPNDEKTYFLYINSLNQYSDKCYCVEHSITEEEFKKYKRKIIDISKNLINKNFKDKHLLRTVYEIIFYYGKEDEKSFYAKKLLEQNFYIIDSDLYFFIKNYITDKQKEKILYFLTKDFSDISFGILAIENMRKKEYEKAYEYFNKAEENRLSFPNIETYHLYKLIIKKMIDKNIKIICMQYPVRSVKSLQEQLKEEQYYNELTFISNEKIFKDALMGKKYDEIFADQFAGDFGHCTNLGNTMIAENIVKTLEKMLNLKLNT